MANKVTVLSSSASRASSAPHYSTHRRAVSLRGANVKPAFSENEYGKRNRLILRMGFASYAHYLASELWASIRARVMDAWRHKCVVCHGAASEVHHLDYDRPTMDGSSLSGLTPMCGKCHRKVEFEANGKKRTLKESEKRFWRLSKRSSARRKRVTT